MHFQEVNELSKADQKELFKALKNDLFPEEENKINKLLMIRRKKRAI